MHNLVLSAYLDCFSINKLKKKTLLEWFSQKKKKEKAYLVMDLQSPTSLPTGSVRCGPKKLNLACGP